MYIPIYSNFSIYLPFIPFYSIGTLISLFMILRSVTANHNSQFKSLQNRYTFYNESTITYIILFMFPLGCIVYFLFLAGKKETPVSAFFLKKRYLFNK